MPNKEGRYNRTEVIESGLPYWVNPRKGWTHQPYPFAILLTKTRCKEFGVPILLNGNEKPSAFRYAAAAGTGTADTKHRYYALYDRTEAYCAGAILADKLFQHEIMEGNMMIRVGVCKVCGCTNDNACVSEDGPCFWVNKEGDLCSSCVSEEDGTVGESAVYGNDCINGNCDI